MAAELNHGIDHSPWVPACSSLHIGLKRDEGRVGKLGLTETRDEVEAGTRERQYGPGLLRFAA